MKKLFILFFAVGLLTACNNSNPFVRNDKTAGKDEKKEKDDRKGTEDDENAKRKKDDYTDGDNTASNWTTSQRDKWLNECIEASQNNPQGRKVCSCVLDKLEKKYPNSKDAENASEAEGTRLAKECMGELGVTTGIVDEQDRTVRRDGEDVTNDNQGGNWTNLQRKQYIQGCVTTASKNQAYTAQQVNSYCDCMTRKVERKYSFQDAAKMTAADFQTQEWQNAAAECMPRN